MTTFGKFGDGPGEFYSPQAIDIDHNDNLYVVTLEILGYKSLTAMEISFSLGKQW